MGIVTDSLVGYWHYQQGVSGGTWANIAPATVGSYNGTITGAIKQGDGMYFDGEDDKITIQSLGINGGSITVEIQFNASITTCSLLSSISSDKRIDLANSNATIWLDSGSSSGSWSNVIKPVSQIQMFTYVLDDPNNRMRIYSNGIKLKDVSASTYAILDNDIFIGYKNNAPYFKGHIQSIKIYNTGLTDAKVAQNYAVGTAIGLAEEPPPAPPSVTIVSTSKSKISDETGMNTSIITFKFDQDVTEWRVRVIGTDQNTGTLADSGGAVAANTNITASVEWNELYQEGQNRVNIYGKGADGQWTPYES
jgi:hypothetical protein